jgi:hypothetical protein
VSWDLLKVKGYGVEVTSFKGFLEKNKKALAGAFDADVVVHYNIQWTCSGHTPRHLLSALSPLCLCAPPCGAI